MLGSELVTVFMLVLVSSLAVVAGILVLVLFARRPKPTVATPSPVPFRPPTEGGFVYRSLTPSSLPRRPEYKPLPISQRSSKPAAILLVRTGPLRDACFPLVRQTIALGRSSRCDITLPDAQASRQHARLEWRRDGLYLVDTQSTNGTYVNGRRIYQARLQGGEQVRISNSVLTIHLY
jgi:hypothetical protein